jgi:ubiquinone/menaquinone biosynthesis C-methylase UbiE
MLVDRGIIAGNVTDKYRAKNPITRALMGRFLDAVGSLYVRTAATRVLEVGCGEGEMIAALQRRRGADFVGSDISPGILGEARRRYPALPAVAQSATDLAFPARSFDLVIACEVLEHLPDPLAALREIARVSRRHVILSVPCEPLWRALNLARGAYVSDLGNTPGHIQHWSRGRFVRFVAQVLRVTAVRSPLPWTVLAATVE